MQKHGENASPSEPLLRRVLSSLIRKCYGLLGPRLRTATARSRLLSEAYNRLARPLLFAAPDEHGLILTRFPEFKMYLDATLNKMPGDVSLGRAWEPATTSVFRCLIRPGDTVIDLGAHWGYYTILAGKLCGPSGRVYGFEPDPKNYSLLAKNIELNQLTNVAAIQKAASHREAQVDFFLSSGDSGSHSLAQRPADWAVGSSSSGTLTVGTVALDEFFAPSPVRPRLVKMDIEGAEPLALRGMRRLISDNRQISLILELNRYHLKPQIAEDMLTSLASAGFRFTVIDDKKDRLTAASLEDVLLGFLGLETLRVLNLLCARDESLIARVIDSYRA